MNLLRALLYAPESILSALDIYLQEFYQKTQGSDSWGGTPPGSEGEDLHPGEQLHLTCPPYMPAGASSVED